MKRFTLTERTTVMQNPTGVGRYFAWPTVATKQDGTLICVASGFRLGHICPFGKAVYSESPDGGRSWTLPTPVIDTPLDDRDGGVAVFGESSLIVTSFNNTARFQNRCVDGWERIDFENAEFRALCRNYLHLLREKGLETRDFGATYRISHDMGVTFGDIQKSPITSPHGPVAYGDGLLWVGRTITDGGEAESVDEVRCYTVTKEGEMTYVSTLPTYDDGRGKILPCEPHAIVLPDGRILVHIRLQRSEPKMFATFQTVSADGGKTWAPLTLLTEEVGGAPAHLCLHSKGRLISVIGHREKPFGIRALYSDDMGETWQCATVTDDAPSWDLGYPATTELPDGRLYLVWYQNEDGVSTVRGGIFDPYEI